MLLSKHLTGGLASGVYALALVVATEPSAAQSRFNGQNDVPGAVVVAPHEQKINPDTIPEMPATGDTSKRREFYMSPSSRCTELEDPLPGGCEANTLLRKNSLERGIIDGEILGSLLTLPPLPPVALVPPPKLLINIHLPLFVPHPTLPPVLAVPLIVSPVPSLPAIHIVYPPRRTPVARAQLSTLPFRNTQAIRIHKTVLLNDLALASGAEAPSSVAAPGAALATLRSGHAGISMRTLQVARPSLAFLKDGRTALETSVSPPTTNASTSFYSEDLSKYGIAHPLRSASLHATARQPGMRYALPGYSVSQPTHIQLPTPNYGNAVHHSLGPVSGSPVRSGVVAETVVKSLVRKSTIAVGSPPYAHRTTLAQPAAFVLR
jgi:hypothetical protein